jgi:hypothetical protein
LTGALLGGGQLRMRAGETAQAQGLVARMTV